MKQNEKDIFLLITNKCSLRCFSCSYGCEDTDNNWFITKKQFNLIIEKLKNTNFDGCTKYAINLIGGDPLLHNDWKEFALQVVKDFPNCICIINTSGPLLASLDDDVIIECCQNNIRFGITLYPSMKLLSMYKKIENKFLHLNLQDYLSWHPLRIIFGKPFIKKNQNNKECFQHNFSNIDYCFIYKDKIYNCQNLFYQNMKNIMISSSQDISDITNNSDLKIEKTEKDCEKCMLTFHEAVLWNFNANVPKKCLYTPLKELYLYDYDNYYLLQHECKEHVECLNDIFFQSHYKEKMLHPIAQTRFLNGYKDIFIPYDKRIPKEIAEILKQQNNLNKFNIYLVSYTNNIEIDSQVYEDFYIPQSNIFFLKAKNFNHAVITFLHNSYLKEKYCLDINDLKNINNLNFLNNLQEKII